MSRVYNRKLKCGCLISSDAGGGLMPCFKEDGSCKKSWDEWQKTEDYQKHLKEIEKQNE